MLFDIRRLRVGRGALRSAGRRPGAPAAAAALAPASSAPPPSSAARSRSRGSPATSRRRSSARPATAPGWRRTPTAPAASSSSTPAPSRRRSPTGCWRRSPGASATRSPTRSRPRSSSPAPPCSGCATGSGSSPTAGETEALAASLESNDGVYFVPALTGLGSPHWDPYARGTIVGLTRGSGRAHLARAALEAIAYQTVDAVRAQEAASGERLELLRADGGATVNRWLMQFQADVLGAPVSVPEISRDDRPRRRLPGRDRDRRLEPRGQVAEDRYVARGATALRAADGAGRSAAGAAGRLEASPGEVARDMGEMKPQVYKDPRPAEYFDQFHAAARKGVGWTYTLARIILTLPTLLLWRVRAIGVENVPEDGPLVLAPNHFSQMDHFFVGLYLRRKIRFMAKSQLFGPPLLTYIYKHGGVFPIRRGHHDDEAFETVRQLIEQGEMLLVYAEGGRSRSQRAGEAETRHRAHRPRIRRPDRPGCDPRLRVRPPVEAVPLSEDHSPVRRAARLPGRAVREPRASARGRGHGLRPGAGDVRGARPKLGGIGETPQSSRPQFPRSSLVPCNRKEQPNSSPLVYVFLFVARRRKGTAERAGWRCYASSMPRTVRRSPGVRGFRQSLLDVQHVTVACSAKVRVVVLSNAAVPPRVHARSYFVPPVSTCIHFWLPADAAS